MGKFDYTIEICSEKRKKLHQDILVVYGEEDIGEPTKRRVSQIWEKIDELNLAIKVLKKED